jgi:hypothetical protein
VLALVVASRFGMLLGLALWMGLGAGALMAVTTVERRLAAAEGSTLAATLVSRFDRWLLLAMALVLLGLGARVSLDRAAPPTGIVLPVVAMTVTRALAMWCAWKGRSGPRNLLQSLEVCLALYALYAIS